MIRELSLTCVAATLLACGSDSNTPAKPALGAQIDRMGRAAVNTALTNPFGLTPATQTPDQAKDAYNAEADPMKWATAFKTPISQNLALFDSLDTVCGNQFAATPAAPAPAAAGRYDTLAGVLADDRLYLQTATGTCNVYLGLEAAFVTSGAIGAGDCGGRTPLENTIDETYSLLAIGAPGGVTNGITVKAGASASLTAFPFLAAPTP